MDATLQTRSRFLQIPEVLRRQNIAFRFDLATQSGNDLLVQLPKFFLARRDVIRQFVNEKVFPPAGLRSPYMKDEIARCAA